MVKKTTNALKLAVLVSGLVIFACVGWKIQFYEDSDLKDYLYETVLGPGCHTLPESHQNISVAIQSDTCVIIYDDLNCATNGWRVSPDSGMGKRESNDWINSYRLCNEIMSYFYETNEFINLPILSKCQNIRDKCFGALVSPMSERCVQLYSRSDCTGDYIILSENVDREGLDVSSFRACDAVTFFGSDDKELLALPVGTTCQTVPPEFQNKSRTCRAEKKIMVFPQPNCKGHGIRVDEAKGMLDVEYLNMNINSFVNYDEIVEFYTQTMYQGKQSTYMLGTHCQNIPSEDSLITSVRSEACVVIYTKLGCRGESLEIQGEAGNHLTDPSFKQARSFHRCQSIKFYVGYNRKGLLYDDTISRGCKTLPAVYWNQTNSIKVMRVNYACVKVYSLADCKGYSTNVFVGGGASVSEYIEGVASFKHCHLKAYADFEEDEPNPRVLGTIESVCKTVSEVNLHSSTTVEVDECTLFYTHPKCYGDPLNVLHRMNVTLPSGYKWFRSCTNTLKFLSEKLNISENTKHEVVISGNCNGIPRQRHDSKFILADSCVAVYSKEGCQGKPNEISAGKIHPFHNWQSFNACKSALRLYNGSVKEGAVYEGHATEKCTNILLPEGGLQFRPNLLAKTNDCVRIFKENNCAGESEYLRFYTETANFPYKSFQSCEVIIGNVEQETNSNGDPSYNRYSNFTAHTDTTFVSDSATPEEKVGNAIALLVVLIIILLITAVVCIGIVVWKRQRVVPAMSQMWRRAYQALPYISS